VLSEESINDIFLSDFILDEKMEQSVMNDLMNKKKTNNRSAKGGLNILDCNDKNGPQNIFSFKNKLGQKSNIENVSSKAALPG